MSVNNKKTVKGGCHCGFVKYELDLTPDATSGQVKATRCNCTFCQKLGTTPLRVPDPSDFRLLSPSSKEDTGLGDYIGRSKTIHRYYCKDCGTHVFMEGFYEFGGQRHDFFTVNVGTIEQPQEGIDLSQVKVDYFDGLHDNWGAAPRDTPWPGGLS